MKTTLFILMLLTSTLVSNAQPLKIAETKGQPATPAEITETLPVKAPRFVFENCGIDLNHNDLKEYPDHSLGNQITKKMYATQKIYVRRHPASIGFTDNTLEIYKPAIYNAINKLDAYFKKAVRRNELNLQHVSTEFSKCLDIAYIAYYEDQTEDLEQALKKAKSPEQLLAVFDSILIKE